MPASAGSVTAVCKIKLATTRRVGTRRYQDSHDEPEAMDSFLLGCPVPVVIKFRRLLLM
jgi:hypothetical protein